MAVAKRAKRNEDAGAAHRAAHGGDGHIVSAAVELSDVEASGHGGMWPGYRTEVIHYPATETTIALQTNRDGPGDADAPPTRIATVAPAADESLPEGP